MQSTDHGEKFAPIPAPPADFATSTIAGTVSSLAFSDPHNGFAWGGSLWTTHDDGRQWHAIHLGGPVEDLASAGGYVYAVISASSGDSTSLWRSPVSSDHWKRLQLPGEPNTGLSVHGNDVILQTFSRRNGHVSYAVAVSHDNGDQFLSVGNPAPGKGCNFDETFNNTIWGVCFASTGPTEAVRSTDGGKKFSAAGPLRARTIGVVAAASSKTAIVLGTLSTASGPVPSMFRTTDGGLTYGPVTPSRLSWESLGFTDATHGIGVAHTTSNSPLRLYATTDAGRSFHAVAL